jgi:hypothetical protein
MTAQQARADVVRSISAFTLLTPLCGSGICVDDDNDLLGRVHTDVTGTGVERILQRHFGPRKSSDFV